MIQGPSERNINTEKTPPHHEQPTTSTPKMHNQETPKEDWSSLMFSSDDSLFDEMTKQLEDDTARPEIDRNLLRNSPISNKTTSTTQGTKKPYLTLYTQATEQMQ